MNGSCKHTSLLRYGNNYGSKKFYSTGLKKKKNFFKSTKISSLMFIIHFQKVGLLLKSFNKKNSAENIFLIFKTQSFSFTTQPSSVVLVHSVNLPILSTLKSAMLLRLLHSVHCAGCYYVECLNTDLYRLLIDTACLHCFGNLHLVLLPAPL